MDIIAAIKDLSGDAVIATVKDLLIGISAPDDVFRKALFRPLYEENYDACRFVLCSLEEKNRTRENITDLWKRNRNGVYVWTIEHVFPEGKNIPEEWVDMIADGDRNLAIEYQEEYVHTLGNLTITGYNPSLSNFSFEKKKNRKSREDNRDVGYRNGLYLNSDIVNQDKWTVDIIKARTEKLVNEIMKLFSW